jgi:hypothetical protein
VSWPKREEGACLKFRLLAGGMAQVIEYLSSNPNTGKKKCVKFRLLLNVLEIVCEKFHLKLNLQVFALNVI